MGDLPTKYTNQSKLDSSGFPCVTKISRTQFEQEFGNIDDQLMNFKREDKQSSCCSKMDLLLGRYQKNENIPQEEAKI